MSITRKNTLFSTIIAFAALIHYLLIVNLPLHISEISPHDDAWFMKAGVYLANFKWFGPYDQMALIKGPGYPIFLALSSWTGLPINAAHALFQITAIGILAWVVLMLTKSRWLGVLVSLTLLLHPYAFFLRANHASRDQIYWPQTIIVFALSIYVLFGSDQTRQKKRLASIILGIVFGWTWLTREEGIWFVPALLFATAICAYQAWSQRQYLKETIINICIVLVGFYVVLGSFYTANYVAYGSFVGVDSKEKNFSKALNVLSGVEVGPRVAFLPLPLDVRKAIADVSPEFRQIEPALAPGGPLSGWMTHGCPYYPQTCGDIAGGWFFWALRDAVALSGHYKTPAKASEKYHRIVEEVSAACRAGALKCNPSLISLMPVTTADQWRKLPSAASAIALKSVALSKRDFAFNWGRQKIGDEKAFYTYWAFLNFPKVLAEGRSIRASGWYYDSNAGRPEFAILDKTTKVNKNAVIERHGSTDIAGAFKDPRAISNRFQATAQCDGKCILRVTWPDGRVLDQDLIAGGPYFVASGSSQLRTDIIVRLLPFSPNPVDQPPAMGRAVAVAHGLAVVYEWGMPILAMLGAVFYLLAVIYMIRRRKIEVEIVIASVCWIMIGTRILLLALIYISSFPTDRFHYVSPITYMVVIGSILSMWSALKYYRTRPCVDGRVGRSCRLQLRETSPLF